MFLPGYTDIVALLVASGAKLNVNDLHYGTPLHAACSMTMPSVACIRFLLKAGMITEEKNYLKFLKSSLISSYKNSVQWNFYRSLTCLEKFAGAGVNAIKNHKTPLHYIAMYSKSVEAAQLLLAYGANVYMQDK